MKTYFDKDTQQWVSFKPRAFWLGINDFYTNEKIYSDDDFYYRCSNWCYVKGVNNSEHLNSINGVYDIKKEHKCVLKKTNILITNNKNDNN